MVGACDLPMFLQHLSCCFEMLYSNTDPEAVVRNKENGFVCVSSGATSVMDVSF